MNPNMKYISSLLVPFFVVLNGCSAQPYLEEALCPEKYIVPIFPPDRPDDEIASAYAELLNTQKSSCFTYSMSHYNNYAGNPIFTYSNHYHLTSLTPHDWGHHALLWKGFVWWDECAGLGWYCAYNGAKANILDPPPFNTYYVKCNDKHRLNSIEADPVSPFTGGTTPVVSTHTSHDPNGGWLCVQEYSPHIAAVIAAMSMYHWNTPVYLNLDWGQYDSSHSWDYKAGVIEKVTLCTSTSDHAHIECGWDTNPWDVASAAACSPNLILDSITVSFFGSAFGGTLGTDHHEFTEHVTFNAADWAQIYDSSMNSGIGAMIMDPPAMGSIEEENELVKKMMKAAKATASKMLLLESKSRRFTKAKNHMERDQPGECYSQKGDSSLYVMPIDSDRKNEPTDDKDGVH